MREYIILVDWDSLRWHRRQLFLQQRATRLKFIFRWALTNTQKVEMKLSDDPSCPLCHHPSKTTIHVLECNSKGARRHQTEAVANLEDTLAALKTHPYLISMIIEAMQHAKYIDFQGTMHQVTWVVEEQSAIRWGLVQFGFVSYAWMSCQQHYNKIIEPNYTLQHSERWARDL